MDASPLPDQHQAVPWLDGAAKAYVFHAAEAEEFAGKEFGVADIIRAELRRRLADQYAGKQRIAGDVPADPEFVVAHILVADDQVLFCID